MWRSSGARAERWEHRLASRWELNRQEKAVLTLLMLRGPQTPGELRTRSERMVTFNSVADVVATLNTMSDGDHPLVRELPRAPGQSATRWRHLVSKDSPKDELEGSAEAYLDQPPMSDSGTGAEGSGAGARSAEPGGASPIAELELRVAALEARLSGLETALGVVTEEDPAE